MKIKSNFIFNTKLIAAHKNVGEHESTSVLIGSALPNVLRIPAGSTIELADSEWPQYEKAAELHLLNEDLVIVVAPVLSVEDQAAADDALEADLRKQMAALKERRIPAEAK